MSLSYHSFEETHHNRLCRIIEARRFLSYRHLHSLLPSRSDHISNNVEDCDVPSTLLYLGIDLRHGALQQTLIHVHLVRFLLVHASCLVKVVLKVAPERSNVKITSHTGTQAKIHIVTKGLPSISDIFCSVIIVATVVAVPVVPIVPIVIIITSKFLDCVRLSFVFNTLRLLRQ